MARWPHGKGIEGLQKAEEHWRSEMESRNRTRGEEPRYPWTVEGILDEQVVLRRHSLGGNMPPDIEAIPHGKEEEMNYSTAAYKITE